MVKNKEELISIIIPVYNSENYLKKCINSVINQTYSNIEIILVDDGSIDNSAKICDAYKMKDKRIKVIHKKNGGASDARNYGLDIAKGTYISFLDSDDSIVENMLEDFYTVIKKENCDIVFGKSYDCNEEIKKIENHFDISKVDLLNQEDCFRQINTNLFNILYPKLYKSSIFDDLRFPKGIICEDSYIAPYIYEKVKKIAILPYYYHYRFIHENSVVHKKFNERDYDLIKVGKARVEYFKNSDKEQVILSYQFLMSSIIDVYKKAYRGNARKKEKRNIITEYKNAYSNIKRDLKIKDKIKYSSFLLFPNLLIKILLKKEIL